MEYELYHHGILGMKWGIRRYQNPDGSLTPAGKKRYQNDDGERMYKDLKRQVRNKRSELNGKSNRWMSVMPIGENSKKVMDSANSNRQRWQNTKEFKNWVREVESFEKKSQKQIESGKMTFEEYDRKQLEIYKRIPKKDFNDTVYSKELINGKWKYADNFINRGGADLTKAYLKDLGYDEKTVDFFIKKMAKAGKTLGDV